MRLATSEGVVVLDGAAPAVGFTLEVQDDGPTRVRVRFRADDHESRLEAEWSGGELVVDIEES